MDRLNLFIKSTRSDLDITFDLNLTNQKWANKKQNIPGMLLLIDFEKAFDSLSWTFIEKALDLFNSKISIKNWIRTLYYNSPQEYFKMDFSRKASH